MARPGLDKHPKYRRLVRMTGEPEALIRGCLELLWECAYEAGDPVIGDADAVEAAAKYPGEPGKLFQSLLDCGGQDRDGFIELVEGESNRYQIHDLYDHCPDYVRRRMAREYARKQKGKTLSDIRAEAGRKGGSKRKQTADSCFHLLSKRMQTEANGATPAPAPAPNTETPSESLSPNGDTAYTQQKSLTLEAFVREWNQTKGVRRCMAQNDARKKTFRQRSKESTFLSHWREALAKFPLECFASDPDGWQPDIDWFLKPKTVTAILEGKYDWRKTSGDSRVESKNTTCSDPCPDY